MGDIVDEIDALVDEQMAGGETGAVTPDAKCPLCHRDWHGLPITQRMEEMRAEYSRRQNERYRLGDAGTDYADSAILGDYRYDTDDSRIICPGPGHLGPLPAWAMCQCFECYVDNAVTAVLMSGLLDPWWLRLASGLGAPARSIDRAEVRSSAPYREGPELRDGDRVGVDLGDGRVMVGRYRRTDDGCVIDEDTEEVPVSDSPSYAPLFGLRPDPDRPIVLGHESSA